jgi:uncharacterized protein involved in copper resistance
MIIGFAAAKGIAGWDFAAIPLQKQQTPHAHTGTVNSGCKFAANAARNPDRTGLLASAAPAVRLMP